MNIWALVSWLAAAGVIALLAFLERKRLSAEKAVLIAALSALSSVGRWIFTALPNIQPSSFIIIMAGITLGADAGFLTGVLTALLSGLLMGIGPWTPFQMAAWGLMGGLAGVLRSPLKKSAFLRVAYGGAFGFIFGWIMNVWMIVSLGQTGAGAAYFLSVYAASFVFDLMHAAANVLLLALGGGRLLKTLGRVTAKYGIP